MLMLYITCYVQLSGELLIFNYNIIIIVKFKNQSLIDHELLFRILELWRTHRLSLADVKGIVKFD